MKQASTLSIVAKLVGETLNSLGYSAEQLYRETGLVMADYAGEYDRVPNDIMDKLWHNAEQMTKDPFLGFIVGEKIQPAMLKSLGFSWLASKTLYDGLQRFVDFSALLSGSVLLKLEVHEQAVHLTTAHPDKKLPGHSYLMQEFVYSLVLKMCKLTGNQDILPIRLVCSDEPQKSKTIAELEKYLKCKVDVGQCSPYIEFDKKTLSVPLTSWSKELTDINDAMIQAYLDNMQKKISKLIAKAVITRCGGETVKQEDIAFSLHVSVKTLQRRLAKEGESFSSIVDKTKLKMAINHMIINRLPIKKTAFLLGYADVPSFSKAFKRWTGDSPASYLAEHSGKI